MNAAILVLNAGSSSLKFCAYDVTRDEPNLVVRGQVDGLGTSPRFQAGDAAGVALTDTRLAMSARDAGHADAFEHLTRWLARQYGGQLTLTAAGHRVVHGGLEFVQPTRVDDEVLARLQALCPLAPLHQPHNLAGIRAVARLRPDLPQVACFDTAFHRGRPPLTERFGLPSELLQQGVRRWGFHGLSFESVAGQFARLAPELAPRRVIIAHLGNGASLCALRHGRSVDTTMSFSTLDGLPMGTRCGSLDPGALLFLVRQRGYAEVEDLLYTKSGLLGLSGVSSDVRDLLTSDSPRAREALGFFVYRVIREIGSLTAALDGLDALIFTAGIGENSPEIRARICQGLEWLGIRIDPHANQRGRGCLSRTDTSPSVWAIPTDEAGVVAAHTLAVVCGRARAPATPETGTNRDEA